MCYFNHCLIDFICHLGDIYDTAAETDNIKIYDDMLSFSAVNYFQQYFLIFESLKAIYCMNTVLHTNIVIHIAGFIVENRDKKYFILFLP